jgi:release factor glutamine methyltransferase
LNARDALREGAAALAAAGIDSPRLDARLLLAEATGLTRDDLLREPGRVVDPGLYRALVARRAAREPLALILGWQEFWSLRFRVSPATLIPRADSETLIEAARALRPRGVASVLDLGTGTGCLLLAALTEFPRACGLGTDRSPAAAALAGVNAAALGLADRADVICANWADPVAARFDLVLSNPPYIETGTIPRLMPEVARHEPASALDGGADGLACYRTIVAELPRLLQPGGLAVLELGAEQAASVAELAGAAGFRRVSTRPDLAGIARALVIEAD